MHAPIEVLYKDGTSETFASFSFIECGDPALIADPAKHRHTDYEMPKADEPWPTVVFITERAGDLSPRFLQDIREIRAA